MFGRMFTRPHQSVVEVFCFLSSKKVSVSLSIHLVHNIQVFLLQISKTVLFADLYSVAEDSLNAVVFDFTHFLEEIILTGCSDVQQLRYGGEFNEGTHLMGLIRTA